MQKDECVTEKVKELGDPDFFLSVADPSSLDTPLTVPGLLKHAVGKWPDRPAVTDCQSGKTLTWSELDQEAMNLAARLRARGAGRRHAFVVASTINIDLLVWAQAVAAIGGVLAPLNLQNSPAEAKFFVDTIGKEFEAVCVAHSEFKDKFSEIDAPRAAFSAEHLDHDWLQIEELTLATVCTEWPEVQPDDPNWIISTSGSTAAPKATLCRHRGLGHYAQAIAWGMNFSTQDRYLGILPWYHLGGLGAAMGMIPLTGAEILLIPKFLADSALDTIDRYAVTSTCAWDGFLSMIEAEPAFHPSRLRSLRTCMLAGMSGYYDQLRAWGLETIFTFYGMSEGYITTAMPPHERDIEKRRMTQGVPLKNVPFRIVDPETGQELPEGGIGEIQYAGPSLMLRYIGMPEETAKTIGDDGYIRSGDRGYLKDGHLYFLGRYKFVIKSGGENVSEAEVEKFLAMNVPGIEAVIVVGVDDKKYGEIVCACIEWKPNQEMDLDSIRNLCRGRLSGFKMPRRLEAIRNGEWPRTASGKVDRLTLKAMANERAIAERGMAGSDS